MVFEKPLIITKRYVLGFNFLFNADLKPVFIRDFVQSIDYPHQFIHVGTGENYCFTSEHDEPYFGNLLLPWPFYGQLKGKDGLCRIYPLNLINEAQEEKIFIEHIWQTYIRHSEHEKGKRNVFAFLEFQYKNKVQGKPQDFVDRVQRILFVDGGLVVAGYDESIEIIRLRALLWEWLRNRRDELMKLLGDQYYSKLESDEIVEKELSLDPPSGNETEEPKLTAAQHLLIEYFSEDKLSEEPSNQQLDKAVRHRELAAKHGLSADNFKKAFKRVLPIIEGGLTPMQERPYKNDLNIVKQHFVNNDKTELAQKVDFALNELNFRN